MSLPVTPGRSGLRHGSQPWKHTALGMLITHENTHPATKSNLPALERGALQCDLMGNTPGLSNQGRGAHGPDTQLPRKNQEREQFLKQPVLQPSKPTLWLHLGLRWRPEPSPAAPLNPQFWKRRPRWLDRACSDFRSPLLAMGVLGVKETWCSVRLLGTSWDKKQGWSWLTRCKAKFLPAESAVAPFTQ